MPVKDFDAARRERLAERDPVRFTLGGETFTLIPRIPLAESFDLLDAPEPAPTNVVESVRALSRFVSRCLIDEDRPRWDALLRRTVDPIDPWSIIDLGAWVAGEYAARPTGPPSESSGGRRTTTAKRNRRGSNGQGRSSAA